MSSMDLDDYDNSQLDDDKTSFDRDDRKKQYVKILACNMNHNGFQYVKGLNVDIHPFTPSGECQKGGLYFCELSDVYLYLGYGTLIADVEIPSDAKVYKEKNKLKADRIIIKNIKPIAEHKIWNDVKFCEKAIFHDSATIQYIKSPTQEMCISALMNDPNNLEYITDPTPFMCKLAITKSASSIQYIKDQTPELCQLAIDQDVEAIRYIKAQTTELCMYAIDKWGRSIEYITHPTSFMCQAAINQYAHNIEYIRDQTPELCKLAVEKDPSAIRYIKAQTSELCWMALKKDRYAFVYIKNPTDAMKKYYHADDPKCVIM